MLYWIAPFLINLQLWGPLRLLGSHLMLLAAGTLTAGFIIWWLMPKCWHVLPTDRGDKPHAADGGKHSAGKPTGAGLLMFLMILPVSLLFAPLRVPELGVLVCLYLCMTFGYLDDKSSVPWGEIKKGLLDLVVAILAALCIYWAQGGTLWLPFSTRMFVLPLWGYLPVATILLFLSTNATNCSDGMDGLAGALTLFSLFALVALLYGVVGYLPIAEYLRLPHNPAGARWAILVAVHAGALAGYLWHNAEPSRVLMGDAGSRLLGMLVGVAVLVAGNPILFLVVSPVILINGDFHHAWLNTAALDALAVLLQHLAHRRTRDEREFSRPALGQQVAAAVLGVG